MADGKGGSVILRQPGYDEGNPLTGNRSTTDYQQQPAVKETRRQAFDDGSKR
jgi:hypothetical protein